MAGVEDKKAIGTVKVETVFFHRTVTEPLVISQCTIEELLYFRSNLMKEEKEFGQFILTHGDDQALLYRLVTDELTQRLKPTPLA